MSGTKRLAAPVGFGLAVVVLVVAGRGELATPPMHDFGRWLEDTDPVTATLAFVRLFALGAAAWMFVFSTVVVVARAVGAVGFAELVESAVPPAVRRALAVAAGVGAVGVPAAGLLGNPARPAPEAIQLIDAHDGPSASTVTMSLLQEPAPEQAPEPDTWTVAAGDSFWSIAEEVVGDQLGRPPTDEEVAPYWHALIDANRDRLVTTDPDLIVPSQVLTVPDAVAAAAAATPRS